MVKTLTLRRAFHDIINTNGVAFFISQISQETLKTVLQSKSAENINPELKKEIEEIIQNLTEIETRSKQTDQVIKQIKEFIYSKLDADKLELSVEI